MRVLRLLLVALLLVIAVPVAAVAFEEGDRVVMVEPNQALRASNGELYVLELGECFDVYAVEDDYVNIDGTRAGWVSEEFLMSPHDAIVHFRKLGKEEPENIEYLSARVRVYCELEDFRPALEELTAAIEDSPEAWLYNHRGNVYRHMDLPDKAILDYTKAMEITGDSSNLYRNIGISYVQMEEYEEALASFEKAIELDGLLAGDYIMCSQISSKLGREEDEVAYLIEGATIDSRSETIQNNLAWILATSPNVDLRDGSRAVRHARLACELTGFADPSSLDTLGAACAEAGDFERAIQCAERVLALLPEDADASRFEARLELYQQGQPYRDVPEEEEAGEGDSAPAAGEETEDFIDSPARSG